MLHSRSLLVIYFIHSSVYVSNPISQFIPPLPSKPSSIIKILSWWNSFLYFLISKCYHWQSSKLCYFFILLLGNLSQILFNFISLFKLAEENICYNIIAWLWQKNRNIRKKTFCLTLLLKKEKEKKLNRLFFYVAFYNWGSSWGFRPYTFCPKKLLSVRQLEDLG